jgi:hypothetical protein
MAIDFLQEIIRYLNINCSVVNCYYSNPMEGLFYLIFFPSIIVILFVYILSNAISVKATGDSHNGFRLLFGVAILIFIIMQGWFTVFVGLSKAWFIVTIVLLGLWVMFRSLFRGEEGGKGKFSTLTGEVGQRIGKKFKLKAYDKLGLMTADERIILKADEKGFDNLTSEEKEVVLALLGYSTPTSKGIKDLANQIRKKEGLK